jgi:copper(I)-binding protein
MQMVYGWLTAGLLALAGGAAVAADRTIVVSDPWVREAPPAASALAAYMSIDNRGDRARLLVGAKCAAFGKVMVHRTVVENAVGKMVHAPSVKVPARGSVVFKPGGYDVMLMRPRRTLTAGDRVEITLLFNDGAQIPVMYTVRKASSAPGSMQHQHCPGVSGVTPRWRISSADKAGRRG